MTSYDKNNKNTFYYVDEFSLVLKQSLWDGDNRGGKDCISRTAMAYKAWGDIDLIFGIFRCFCPQKDKRGDYIKVYRHPKYAKDDMSRDHILGVMLALKFAERDDVLKDFISKMRWRISEKYTFTVDLWAWMQILSGKWWWNFIYYPIAYPTALFNVLWNKFWLHVGKFSKETHPLNWDWRHVSNASDKQIKIRQLLFPTYALEQFAWQLYVLKPNIFIKGLQWMVRKMTSRYNFLIKLLAGDKSVREIDVKTYRQMTGGRWTVTLNETCDRHVEIIHKKEWIEANRLEEDLLKKIWEETRQKVDC